MADPKEPVFPTQEEIEDFKKRVKIVEDGIAKLLKESSLEMINSYDIPRYNPEHLPDEVKLALTVLNTHGMVFTSKFRDIKKGKK